MPALPQYYVDPAAGSDTTGTGAIGTPWQTLQHALDTISAGTYGDQVNLKAGTADVLTADLDFSTYAPGSPNAYKKLVVRGYTSAANDGGRGSIDGNASFRINALNDTAFIDLEIKNTDPARDGCAGVNNYSQMINVYMHTINRDALGGVQGRAQLIDCRFENISRTACRAMAGYMRNCYFANGGTYSFTNALNLSAQGHIHNCFFSLSGSSNGVDVTSLGNVCLNCTIFSNGGTGTGYKNNSTDARGSVFTENIVAGFSGTGGIGCDNTSEYGLIFTNNTFHNNATAFNDPTTAGEAGYAANTGNETVGSSPLAQSGTNDFANRLTYFAPQNVGSVLSGDFPRGAAPSAAAGGGLLRVNMNGNVFG